MLELLLAFKEPGCCTLLATTEKEAAAALLLLSRPTWAHFVQGRGKSPSYFQLIPPPSNSACCAQISNLLG